MVGSLFYFLMRIRLDIVYVVSNVFRFNVEFIIKYMIVVKCILWYFNGICDLGLLYRKDEMNECIGYLDVDWVGDLDDCKFILVYIFYMGGVVISWRSKR